MLPTFETSGEVAIESIVSHRLAPYNLTRGELVSLKSPVKPNRIICKRIIGLPGDVVCVDPTGLKAPSVEHVVVPKGHIWIAGDNAACSTDSRDYGPVSMGLIRGRIIARVSLLYICRSRSVQIPFGRCFPSIDSKSSLMEGHTSTSEMGKEDHRRFSVQTCPSYMNGSMNMSASVVIVRSSLNSLLDRLVQT